jgi:hypothetical protein
VRNSGGAHGRVRGIRANDVFDIDGPTIRNVSVDVNGGIADDTNGITVGEAVLRDVEVSVDGGSQALGIFTNCADAADVHVRVTTAANAQSAIGWQEASQDCRPPVIVRFNVSVFGSNNSIGMRIEDRSGELAEGIIVAGGIGISAIGGEPDFRNLRVTASTAVQMDSIDFAFLDNIEVRSSDTALDVGEVDGLQVTDSTLSGETVIRGAFSGFLNIIRIDSSSMGPITIEDPASVFIGASKVTGPIVPGAGQLTCVNVYDQNYQPITCD